MGLPNIIQQINSKLPLSGGKLTGEIIRSGIFVTGSTNNGRLVLRGGTDSTSSLLQLVGKESPEMAGWVALTASDGTNTNHLTVQPNGTGTLNGNVIITSAGGNLTGSLVSSSTNGYQTNSSSHCDYGYDYNERTGALLAVRSSEYTNNPGGFELVARNATENVILAGKTDGTLTWNAKPVVSVTRWTSGTSGYRKYADGFIEQWGKCTSRNITVTFPLAFSNTNYTLVGGLIPGDPTTSYQHLNFKSQTATSFYFQSYDNYTCKWYACGY